VPDLAQRTPGQTDVPVDARLAAAVDLARALGVATTAEGPQEVGEHGTVRAEHPWRAVARV